MDFKNHIKVIREMAKVLSFLADELEKDGEFRDEDLELLSKVGAKVLFNAKAYSFKK